MTKYNSRISTLKKRCAKATHLLCPENNTP